MENFSKNMMFAEICAQTGVFGHLVRKYINGAKILMDFPLNFSEIKFVASGSSYNCARLGQKFFENVAKIKASFEYSSEFNSNPEKPIDSDVLYFFISQSGKTHDTKCALDLVKSKGGHTFALVNNNDSYIYNTCEFKMDIEAGLEKSIAATKSFTGGVLCLWLIALYIAQNKGFDVSQHLFLLKNIETDIDFVIENIKNIDEAANLLSGLKAFPVVGYGYNYVIAKEGALKIKETSYIDVNAYPTGEFLHGHTAILNENSVILEVFTSSMGGFEVKTLDKIKKDYSPKIVAITDIEPDCEKLSNCGEGLKPYKDAFLTVQFKRFDDEILRILALIVVLQLLALNIAQKLGRNVDKPIGLNKVVGEG